MTDFTKFGHPFQKYSVGTSQQNRKGQMVVNDFGRHEVIFVYVNISAPFTSQPGYPYTLRHTYHK